ncbi:MAG TPA: 2-phosphosulfolactate phosphatase [Polyangia bacterium]|jgi:2-phosphosulfolactate phosphatase
MPRFVIDFLPEAAKKYCAEHAIVAVDVIRATTTACTAVAIGWRCFPTPSLEAAVPLAARLTNPLLAGELGGNMPYGFDMTNSPAEIAARTDLTRPMILLSTAGTQLLHEGRAAPAVYAACMRNVTAQARHLVGRHEQIALIGAGSRGEFREEDQYCCARIGAGLMDAGYEPEDDDTRAAVERWRGQPPTAFLVSNSVRYLERTNQLHDLDFVLEHIDDLMAVFVMKDGELVMRPVQGERMTGRPRPTEPILWEGAP